MRQVPPFSVPPLLLENKKVAGNAFQRVAFHLQGAVPAFPGWNLWVGLWSQGIALPLLSN